jgi:protein SCO1/2
LGLAVLVPTPASARSRDQADNVVSEVGFDQKLGARLPLELRFRDDSGHDLALGELFGRRPLILAPVYFRCPMLCNQVLSGLTRSLKPLELDAGKEFDVLAVSIDPEESPELAAGKRAIYLDRYARKGTESGWHFLTGDQAQIAALCEAIGFRYSYNPQTRLYVHAAGIVLLTSDGRVARYFYGIDYPSRELQYELTRAGMNRIGSPISRLLLLCYDYDAATGRYTLSILRLLRGLGIATAIALVSFVLTMLHQERRFYRSRIVREGPQQDAHAPELPGLAG